MNKKKVVIAIDAMGGDNAPFITIDGAKIVAQNDKNIHFLFYGDADIIKPLIEKCSYLKDRFDIIHTKQFISNDDKPSSALRKSKQSSMRLAINSTKDLVSDATVSAGNTGALMTISKIVLGVLPVIDRPAIVALVPNQKKKITVMLDAGANIHSGSDILYQFTIMGYVFAKVYLQSKNPKIGLLNIGSEELKGNDAVKNTASLIKNSELADSFYGYVEGDDIAKGTVDVVVTDGFCGNIALKSMEGIVKTIFHLLRDIVKKSFFAKITFLMSFFYIKKIINTFDPNLYNGAMLIGLNGIVVKSHGGAEKKGFANAIKVAASLARNRINDKIINEIKSLDLYNEDRSD